MTVIEWMTRAGRRLECSSRTCHDVAAPKKACSCLCAGRFHGRDPLSLPAQEYHQVLEHARRTAERRGWQILVAEQLDFMPALATPDKGEALSCH